MQQPFFTPAENDHWNAQSRYVKNKTSNTNPLSRKKEEVIIEKEAEDDEEDDFFGDNNVRIGEEDKKIEEDNAKPEIDLE